MTKLGLPGDAGGGMRSGPEGVWAGAGGSEEGCDWTGFGVSVRGAL